MTTVLECDFGEIIYTASKGARKKSRAKTRKATDALTFPQDVEVIVPTEKETYSLDELERISSVIRDLVFFVQPKYKIASAIPGSGNTKHIGSVTRTDQLLNGTGPFSVVGEAVYDDYWMNYLTRDMAAKLEIEVPYHNLETYAQFKNRSAGMVSIEEGRRLD